MSEWSIGVMGDPHGHYSETLKLLKETGFINDRLQWTSGERTLICVGDYVDRGPEGLKVIDLLMKLQEEVGAERVQALLGNHDVLLLSAYHFKDEPSGGPGGTFYQDWLINGGVPEELDQLTSRQMGWLSKLPAMTVLGSRLIAHADSTLYLEYGKTLDEVNSAFREILSGRNSDQWDVLLERFSDRLAFYHHPHLLAGFLETFGGTQFIHGHTPIAYMDEQTQTAPYVYAGGKAVNVDACAYNGNPLAMYPYKGKP